jgi:hypothetical protein
MKYEDINDPPVEIHTSTRSPNLGLRIAAGVFVILGIITAPFIFIGEDGWRKAGVIPIICLCFRFAIYAFKGK